MAKDFATALKDDSFEADWRVFQRTRNGVCKGINESIQMLSQMIDASEKRSKDVEELSRDLNLHLTLFLHANRRQMEDLKLKISTGPHYNAE